MALEKSKSLSAGHWHIWDQESAPEAMRICVGEGKQKQPALLMVQKRPGKTLLPKGVVQCSQLFILKLE